MTFMFPILFQLGSLKVYSYGFFLGLAFGSVYLVLRSDFPRKGLPLEFALVGLFLASVGGVIGSRIFHVLDHWNEYGGSFFAPSVKSGRDAGSFYGGLVFGTLFVWLGCLRYRFTRRQIAEIADSAFLSIPLAYAIARIGCFLAGDGCYGKVCEAGWPSPFCMSFPQGTVPTTAIVYNTPLMESVLHFVFFFFLFRARTRTGWPLQIVALYCVVEGVLRFGIETIRINPLIGLGMSQAQWVSIGLIGVGGMLLRAGPGLFPSVNATGGGKQTSRRSQARRK